VASATDPIGSILGFLDRDKHFYELLIKLYFMLKL
jgi:hypothetical protein